jgi:ketosteroid isomerase-like protein
MARMFTVACLLLICSSFGFAQSPAPDAAELTRLVNEFLTRVSDPAMHDRFWAEDLIYTGSSGRRVGKADIMRDMRSAPAPKPNDPKSVYTAEDVRIQQYGTTAIVAFRLVSTTTNDGKTDVSKYLNTGTFLKRDGKWRVVSWQATKLPRAAEDVKNEVAAAEADFHQAMLKGDVAKLEALLDETFVRTFRDGSRQTRKETLDEIASGRLKFTKLETRNVSVEVYGDAAVARGASVGQRAAVPGGEANATPFELFYTMTLVNKGGEWKIVALHASHP